MARRRCVHRTLPYSAPISHCTVTAPRRVITVINCGPGSIEWSSAHPKPTASAIQMRPRPVVDGHSTQCPTVSRSCPFRARAALSRDRPLARTQRRQGSTASGLVFPGRYDQASTDWTPLSHLQVAEQCRCRVGEIGARNGSQVAVEWQDNRNLVGAYVTTRSSPPPVGPQNAIQAGRI